MTSKKILEEIKTLPPAERLKIAEEVLHTIRKELRKSKGRTPAQRKRLMAKAAKSLLRDYSAGGELTAFTALDSEDFHAPG